jgi:hypothetical protein
MFRRLKLLRLGSLEKVRVRLALRLLMNSASEGSKPRRRRIHVLKDKQHLETLDLWPGDEVWHDDFTLLGVVDDSGTFVPDQRVGLC